MNRDEFEVKYAQKYMELSFVNNHTEAIESVEGLRDGEGYTDHHIDLCWKVQQVKNARTGYAMIREINRLEW